MAVALITTLSTMLLMLDGLSLSLTANINKVCSGPKRVKNTKMNFEERYEVNSHLRYMCEDGYKRKAGTSNLAICQFNNITKRAFWKYANISCIRDPSISLTTPSSTKTQLNTSESSSNYVFTTSVETFTTKSPMPTVKIHETPYTTQEKVTQTTPIPGHTPKMWSSTISDLTAPGRTHTPESSSNYVFTKPVETFTTKSPMPTIKIHETPYTTQEKVTQTKQIPGHTPKMWSSTINDLTAPGRTHIPDTHTRTLQETTIMAIAGTVGVLILLAGVLFILVLCHRREQTSRNLEDTQPYLQTAYREDTSPISDTSPEEEDETLL